jgi:hypothetical protein
MRNATHKALGIETFQLPGNRASDVYFGLLYLLYPIEWMYIAVIFFSFSFCIKFYNSLPDLLIRFRKLYIAFVVLGLIGLFLGIHREYLLNGTDEFLLIEKCSLKKSPDGMSPDISELKAGTKLLKTLQIGNWMKVQTPEYDLGWVSAEKLKVIKL